MFINHLDKPDVAENRLKLWQNLNILCEAQYIKLTPQDNRAHVRVGRRPRIVCGVIWSPLTSAIVFRIPAKRPEYDEVAKGKIVFNSLVTEAVHVASLTKSDRP